MPTLDARLSVETPEQITLAYTIAGIGSRAAAALIDYAIAIGSLVIVFIALVVLLPAGRLAGSSGMSTSWALAVLILLQFAVLWGYYVVFEGLCDGQTPGKRLLGLRVVQDGGYSVSFSASAVRNLARLVDAQPVPLYLVGMGAALINKSGKRVGDMMAGTFVVKEGRGGSAGIHAPTQRADVSQMSLPVTALLTDDEFGLLERYMSRRQSLAVERRKALAQQLAIRFADRLPTATDTSSSAHLLRLFEREREARSRGVASRSDTGAKREQHAIIALGAQRWNDFAVSLADAQQRGLGAMSETEVSTFVAQYRELTTDLARLQTAARGRDIDALFFLSRLVARGHALLYRQRRSNMQATLRYITYTVPREIRRSAAPIVLAAALMFGPAVITYTVVWMRPATAAEILPLNMLERANEGAARQRHGQGYVTIDELERPIAASSIITNNVQVTYAAFVLGITAGIGTVAILVFNGIALGGAAGLFAAKGVGSLLLAFVAPHGVLELTAITIAAGGGLLIASALLLPGALTRREALVVNGRRATALVAGSTLLLIVAGTIEGLVSPQVWPLEWKLAVSGVTAAALIWFLSLGRGSAQG